MRVGQDDAVVAEDIIHQVKQMERGMSPEVTYRLEIGSKVAITSGVFSGYRARTLEVMGRRRIKLELEGLQNLRVIEMPVSQVMAY